MYIGNVMLMILNVPLIGLFVQLLKVPYGILSPLIIMFVMLGAYALKNSVSDLATTILFGLMGYLMKRFGIEPAPLILAFVLGPMLENNLSKAHRVQTGNPPALFAAISATPQPAIPVPLPLFRWPGGMTAESRHRNRWEEMVMPQRIEPGESHPPIVKEMGLATDQGGHISNKLERGDVHRGSIMNELKISGPFARR
jgi:hypothetical protein